jgi:hypothetical protein
MRTGFARGTARIRGTWKHFPSWFVFLPARYTSRLALRIPIHRTIQLSYCFFLKPSEGTRILGPSDSNGQRGHLLVPQRHDGINLGSTVSGNVARQQSDERQ